jgi:hypothetical protein
MKLILFLLYPVLIHAEKKINDTIPDSGFQRSTKEKSYKMILGPNPSVQKGLFVVYSVAGKYYLEISDTILGRDLLMVSRISRSAAGSESLLSGDEVSTMVISFEKTLNNKVVIRKKVFTTNLSDSSAPTFQAVARSSFMPIIASFDVEAVDSGKGVQLIDFSDYLLGDNEGVSIDPLIKGNSFIGPILSDKSYIKNLWTFKENLEIITEKTFNRTRQYVFNEIKTSINEPVSYELNTSVILLPGTPMQQRFADDRVGYFSINQVDYDLNPSGVKIRSCIKRWRLEPKKKDMQRYLRGELVEPQKPIVFYIDAATPTKWVPYLIQGVNDWQTAFEQAGFKNAIKAVPAPSKEQDSSWSLLDSRHSAIVYKASTIENASGPSISDPRTGEILESHINWYHNVMQLVHNWYMVQCGAVDTSARKMVFTDSLMGQLIRFVCSHEVGHTLGLLHNMQSSATVPVDSLRNREWLKANGLCPSIMDYARFDYVAQPEDSISQSELMPRIGVYDKWAIEWGYRLFPQYKTPESEKGYLNKWIIERTSDKRLMFGSEKSWDPRAQKEDLSNDVVKANRLGIKNLKRILPHLIEWTSSSDGDGGYGDLNEIYTSLVTQYTTYLNHAVSYIGGFKESVGNSSEKFPVYSPITFQQQEDALKFLDENLFQTPKWIIDTAILNRTGQTATGIIGDIQYDVLKKLLYPPVRFLTMTSRNESFNEGETFGLIDLLIDFKKDIWTELYNNKNIDLYRRSLQSTYVNFMTETYILSKSFLAQTFFPVSGRTSITAHDVAPIIEGHLRDLQTQFKIKIKNSKDQLTIWHLQYLDHFIQSLWQKK